MSEKSIFERSILLLTLLLIGFVSGIAIFGISLSFQFSNRNLFGLIFCVVLAGMVLRRMILMNRDEIDRRIDEEGEDI